MTVPPNRSIDQPSSPRPRAAGRLLLVDDRADLRSITARLARILGYDVTVAATAQEATEHWAPGLFDVLVTDLELGTPNGGDLIRLIRLLDTTVAIVATSGGYNRLEEYDAIPEAIRPSVVFMPKPFGMGDLTEAIGKAIRVGAA